MSRDGLTGPDRLQILKMADFTEKKQYISQVISKNLFCCMFLFLWTFTSHCSSNQDENCTNSSWSQFTPIRYNGSRWFLGRKILKHLEKVGTDGLPKHIKIFQRSNVVRSYWPSIPSCITKTRVNHLRHKPLPWVVFEHFKS